MSQIIVKTQNLIAFFTLPGLKMKTKRIELCALQITVVNLKIVLVTQTIKEAQKMFQMIISKSYQITKTQVTASTIAVGQSTQ